MEEHKQNLGCGWNLYQFTIALALQPEESYGVSGKVKNCVLGAFENQDYQYDQIISLLNQEERLEGKLIHVHLLLQITSISKPRRMSLTLFL
ncbi:hypothetical protein CS542_07215 [Pedobacter sp. IW39]|nr:hypothetical protein CS542_07215 [Pedobacter sp. IW39]